MIEPTAHLLSRAEGACELCSDASGLSAYVVPPHEVFADEHAVLLCETCRTQVDASEIDDNHWYCLQQSAWSQVPAVQVMVLRLLDSLSADWAPDLRSQLYIEEDVLAWSRHGQPTAVDSVDTVDSNGTPLSTGDSVTLIKDLVVKGAGFTAKRGTVVKSILVTEETGIVEGRINRTAVVLKSCFLKKVV